MTDVPAGAKLRVRFPGAAKGAVLAIQGPAGGTGPAGPPNSLSIGTVSGGASAGASITGTAPSQTLNLTLPKGDKGDTGDTGAPGAPGADGADGVIQSVNGKSAASITLDPNDVGAAPAARTVTGTNGITGGGDLSADRTLSLDQEFVRDLVAAFVQQGANITVTHDDAGNTLTIAATGLASDTGGGREKVATLSGTTGSVTANLANASIFTVTPTGNLTISLSNPPASGTSLSIKIRVAQGSTPRTVAFSGFTAHWFTDQPTQTANKVTNYVLESVDGGSNVDIYAGVEK